MSKFNNGGIKIKLGWQVKDSITGFEGITTGRFEYLNGCVRFEVCPMKLNTETGIPPENLVFDEPQLEVVDTFEIKPETSKKVGGPTGRRSLLSR
ncbi:MAG: hypothetical protein WC365_03590 [Candidatus Babeliales bacterium]|jgi:hypothetical protein